MSKGALHEEQFAVVFQDLSQGFRDLLLNPEQIFHLDGV